MHQYHLLSLRPQGHITEHDQMLAKIEKTRREKAFDKPTYCLRPGTLKRQNF